MSHWNVCGWTAPFSPEKRGVPTAVLSQVPAKYFVFQNDHLDGVIFYYKALDRMDQPGDETKMLAENTVTETDARKALALLKLKMRKWEEKG